MALTKINQNNRLHQGTIDDEQIAKGFDVNPIIDKVNSFTNGTGTDLSVSAATVTTLASTTATVTTVNATTVNPTNLLVTTQTLTAAGSIQGDAGAITGQLVFVTGADATKGVKLPAVGSGKFVIILNMANAVLKIYPSSGEKLNGGTANASVSVAAYSFVICGYKAAGDWNVAESMAAA